MTDRDAVDSTRTRSGASRAVRPPDDTREVVTFCRICEAACGLVATVGPDGQVQALRPDADHVTTRGYACVKGVNFAELHASPDRLDVPQRRSADGGFAARDWDAAIGEIGATLRRLRDTYGPHSIAVYLGNPPAFSTTATFAAHGFVHGLGTRNFYNAGTQDCANKFAVADAMYGAAYVQPIPDIDRAEMVVICGSNPAISQMSFVQAPKAIQRLKAVHETGGRVVFVDPRRTESARATGEHLGIRPGTDVFFLAAFLHTVLATPAAVDADAVDRVAHGRAELAAVVADWTPERCAEVTGIDADALRRLVRDFLAADGAVLYCSTGVNQGPHGTLAFWLLNVINLVTGNLDRLGGTIVPPVPFEISAIARRLGIGDSDAVSRIGGFDAVLDALPGAILADEILTDGPERVRALIVIGGNPLLSFPNETHLAEALDNLDLLVSIDLFRNETGEHADWVLPAKDWLERGDIPALQAFAGFQPEPYLQYSPAVAAPKGTRRDELWILRELAAAAGITLFSNRVVSAAVMANRAAGRGLARLPLIGARAAGVVDVDHERLVEALAFAAARRPAAWLRRYRPHGIRTGEARGAAFLGTRRVLTDDHKVRLAPESFVAAAGGLEAAYTAELVGRDRLRLISKRERHSHNSWTHNMASLVTGSRASNAVWLHPDDAAARGLADGDVARITGAGGSVTATVRLTEDLVPGACAMPHGWGHARASGLTVARELHGENVNRVAPDGPASVDRLSGMAHLTALDVDIAPAGAEYQDEPDTQVGSGR